MPEEARSRDQLIRDELLSKVEKANDRWWLRAGAIAGVLLVVIPVCTAVVWAITDRATNIDRLDRVSEVQKHVIEKLESHDGILNANALKLTEIQKDVSWMVRSMGGKSDEPKADAKK